MLLRLLHRDAKFGGADALPFHRFERDCSSGVQRMDRSGDGVAIRARIRQRADGHIAADAGEGVEIAGECHVSIVAG